MNNKSETLVAALLLGLLLQAPAIANAADEETNGTVTIKAWKDDVIDLYDKPSGKIAIPAKDSSEVPVGTAERAGHGWLKIVVGGKPYFVEASLAQTDYKLSGPPPCEKLQAGAAVAATRGLGGGDCKK